MTVEQSGFNFCGNCGAQTPSGKKFCTRCGAPIKQAMPTEDILKCSSCGFENPEDSMFCMKCSNSVAQMMIVIEEDDITTVKINTDKIDFENHKELLPTFNKILKSKIVLDLAKVKWIDSTGIGTLVTLTYKAGQSNQVIKLLNVNDKVLESIRMLQVDNVLDIAGSINEA
ncbi:MAG: zinc-ribbon domain-containing protein, partial [bacterium]